MDPFALFETTNYTFLKLESKASGNTVVQEYEANGIVKLRDGYIQADNVETAESSSTVHVRPSEAFIADVGGNLVGHGLRIVKDAHGPLEYRITGQVEGFDFDLGELAFYKVTLKREKVSQWPSSLPLE